MADIQGALRLNSDEFAFHFQGETGVDARELGVFLQRAATIAQRRGVELRVISLEPGSLAVKIRALKKSISKEFAANPVKTTAAAVAIVATVVGAIYHSMSTEGSAAPSAIAKAGADIVETCKVTEIRIITINQNTLIMNQETAREVRRLERAARSKVRDSGSHRVILPVQRFSEDAASGSLTGEVVYVKDTLHFRPIEHSYLVPINPATRSVEKILSQGGYFRVKGELVTYLQQPNHLIVDDATPF